MPGQPPVPNGVNVDLDSSGEFAVYNLQGTVHIIIDVVGYFDDHTHDRNDIRDEPGVSYAYDALGNTVKDTDILVREMVNTEIRVPADGYVAIEVTGSWRGGSAGHDQAACQLQKGAKTGWSLSGGDPWFRLAEGASDQNERTSFSAHRVMPIFAADNPVGVLAGQQIMLVCDGEDGTLEATQLHISATYFPTRYDTKRIL